MSNHWRFWSEGVVIAGLMLCWSGAAVSPSGGASRAAAGAAANTALNKNIGKHKSPTSLDDSLGLVRPADLPEESAFKAFQFVSPGIMSKKIELGEVFLQKYQLSRYRAPVYSALPSVYLVTNQVPKIEDAGEKAPVMNPNEVQVLAMLGQTLPKQKRAARTAKLGDEN